MSDINKNSDPLKNLIRHHRVVKAPDRLTNSVMGMIESNVILEEESKSIFGPKFLYAVAAVFIALFASSFFIDLSLLDFQSLENTLRTGQVENVFHSFIQLGQYMQSIFNGLASNKLFIIVPVAIASLVVIDNILKTNSRHAVVF